MGLIRPLVSGRQSQLRIGLLLLACLVPRIVVAWRLPTVCDDGFSYLHIADSLDRGRFDQALEYLNLNIYPLVLSWLHACGLEWTVAGKAWGIVMGTAIAIPLFNWLARMFDERIATAGVFLYAVHPKLIEYSVEPIREATFWFFFVLALDFLYRSCQERRWWQFAAAGTALALALHTRIEGWFLLLPLAVWGIASFRHRAAERWRIAAGWLLCLSMTPLLVLVMNVTVLAHYPQWQFGRLSPFLAIAGWVHSPAKNVAQATNSPAVPASTAAAAPTAVASTNAASASVPGNEAKVVAGAETPAEQATKKQRRSEIRSYLLEFERTLGIPFLLLAAVGGWSLLPRLRDPRMALLPFWTAATLLAIWFQLKHAGEINGRYFLTLTFVDAGFAGAGCLAIMGWLQSLARRQSYRLNRIAAAGLVPFCLLVAGWSQAFASHHNGRRLEAKLGLWARSQCGPIHHAVSDFQAIRPAYFASGELPAVVTYDEFFNKEYDQNPPDLLVIDPSSFAPRLLPLFEERAHDLGLVPLDQQNFSSAPPRFVIYVRPRRPAAQKTVQPAVAENVDPAHAEALRPQGKPFRCVFNRPFPFDSQAILRLPENDFIDSRCVIFQGSPNFFDVSFVFEHKGARDPKRIVVGKIRLLDQRGQTIAAQTYQCPDARVNAGQEVQPGIRVSSYQSIHLSHCDKGIRDRVAEVEVVFSRL
jgi:Dolichyl-phosphate-mannose-protein mannosyltransferase